MGLHRVGLWPSLAAALLYLLLSEPAVPCSGAPGEKWLPVPAVTMKDTVLGVRCNGFQLVRPHRPRVGLALSGGGVRALAQIGVLKALKEGHIPVDVIVGTSMGSIVGGLFACGMDPDEIWRVARSIRWGEILQDRPPRAQLFLGQKRERERHIIQLRLEESSLRPDIPLSYSPGQKLSATLTSLVLRSPFGFLHSFDQLPVRLRVLATDLINGKLVVITSGDLAEAMRASASIPLLFSPMEWNGSLLVDGGLLSNIPVEEVREAGAEIIIAVDTTSPLRKPKQLDLPWEMADQVTTIMQLERNKRELSLADVAIRVPLADQSAVEFRDFEKIFEAGYERAQQQIPTIQALLASREDSLIQRLWNLRPDSLIPVSVLKTDGCSVPDSLVAPARGVRARQLFHFLATEIDSGSLPAAVVLRGDTLELQCRPAPRVERIHLIATPPVDSLLYPALKPWVGRPLSYVSFHGLLVNVLRALKAHGLALARVEQATYDANTGTLALHIRSGIIHRIHIKGARRTRDFVILREFPLRPGDEFILDRALDGISNVYSTGLFDWVGLSVREVRDGYDLMLRVRERSPRLLRFGARYDLERRGKLFAEYSDENLMGAGNTLSITGLYGVRDQGLFLAYRIDRILRTYLTTEIEFYRLTGRHFTYSGNRRVGEYRRTQSCLRVSFGQQMRRLGTVWLSIRWENIDLDPVYGLGYPTGAYDLRTMGLVSVVDTRDRIPFARSGKHHEWYYEYSSGKFLTSQISYTKLASKLETFVSRGRHTFHPRLAWGISDLSTPFPVQYTLGGLDSFFGLLEDQMRGRHFICASLEYRFALPWGVLADWYWGARIDWGAIWENNTSVSSKDFFYGLGTYLAADTILGPMIIAYGRTQHGSTAFYLSLGRNF